MKKVLLIDDRPDRYSALLKNASISLDDYLEDTLDIVLKDKNDLYCEYKSNILQNKIEFLNNYSTIIIHR